MPKIKVPVKSPNIDMTPMVDLFSLLLTFFMLTTTFRPQEAAQVDTPNSISEKTAPEKDVITISISKDNRVFFNIDNGKDSSKHYREELIKKVDEQFQLRLNKVEMEAFVKGASFGMPSKNIKSWLDEKDSKLRDKFQTGIPIDSADNQLAMWVRLARLTAPNADVAIRGDSESDYETVKKVMDIMQENKVNKFNLVTNLQKQEVKLEN